MERVITTPFANNGLKSKVPLSKQPDGSVSYEEGFGTKYNDPIDQGGRPIEGEKANQIFNDITTDLLKTVMIYNRRLAQEDLKTVGTGGNFSNIGDALELFTKYKPTYKNNLQRIQLLRNFQMQESIIAEGIDLSWIEISHEDGPTGSVTADFNYAKPLQTFNQRLNSKSMFQASFGGKLPSINCSFEFINASSVTGERVMLIADGASSSAYVKRNVSFVDKTASFHRGILATDSASISCYSAKVYGVNGSAFQADNASLLNCHLCIAENCGGNIYWASENSIVDARSSKVLNPMANSYGYVGGEGSVNAPGVTFQNVKNSGVTAYYVYTGGSVKVSGSKSLSNTASITKSNIAVNTLTSAGIVFWVNGQV